ncbi:MAG: acyl-CoA dehydratase activase [Pseudomonadota bacterium]
MDVGSTTTKAVLIDDAGKVVGFEIIDTGHDRNRSGEEVLAKALNAVGSNPEELRRIFSTGYGRRSFLRSEKAVPEIICHARGTAYMRPDVRTIIDIGGQDVKVIEMDGNGGIIKFDMNDKCAAGTGRFFEVLSARLLNVGMDDLGELALKSGNPCLLSSMCTVFAESEIISYLSEGVPREDIAMGILDSVAKRIWAMGRQARIAFTEPIVISGGLAKNIALKRACQERFGKEVSLVENPQMPAPLGAALMARDEYLARQGQEPLENAKKLISG